MLAAPGAAKLRPATIIRDQTIARLSDAFANDLIDVDEFERRVTVAQRSDSLNEIQAAGGRSARPRQRSGASAPAPAAARGGARSRGQAARDDLHGHGRRRAQGELERAPLLNVGVVMGGAKLDLREAWLPPGTIELRVAA